MAYAITAPKFFPAGGIPQSQFQENVSRIEDLVYSRTAPRVVIVGSSMSARFEAGMLPEGSMNLSFSGDSALAGLQALDRSGLAPEVVLAEVNDSLLRAPDEDLLAYANLGIRHEILRRVPVLRQKFQPYCLLLAVLKGRRSVAPEEDVVPADFESILAVQLKASSELRDESHYEEAFAALNTAAEHLRDRGSKVVFFDPPREPRILAGEREAQFRKFRAQYFAAPVFEVNDPGSYHTSDGIHLLPSSAARFVRKLAALTQ